MNIKIKNLDFDNIKKQFPKSYNKLFEYITETVEAASALKDKNLIDKLVQINLELNHRSLFDFFDRYKVYIGIEPDADGGRWWVTICAVEVDHAPNRNDAEILGIKEAFVILERTI